MKSQNFTLKTSVSLLLSSVLLTLGSQAFAAPGSLSSEPLQTSTASQPNIMFTLDSSGSMNIVSPEPIPASYTSPTCNTAAKIPDGATLRLDIDSGAPEIEYSGSDRTLGNVAGTNWCFDDTYTYNARLDENLTGSFGYVPYSGKYLNWYFDTSTDVPAAATWTNLKPGARTRMEVARESMSNMIDTLENVRVGLATFDSGSGADIDVEIDDLDSTHKTTIKTAIAATNANGSTPLSETLRDLGLYFSHHDTSGACGGGSTNLTIHPDEAGISDTPAGRKEDVACSTLLGSRISSSVKGPVEAFCQKNFAVMMTDGVATSDTSIDSHLQDYDADCTTTAQTDGGYTCSSYDKKDYDPDPDSDYWDDVAQALYEIDLRPDLNDQNGDPVTNNLTTFTIGFADKQIENSQLMKDTAAQGGGEFLYAADADGLRDAFEKATKSIIEQSSTAAAVTFNSSTLSNQSAVYQALFNTVRWSGELRSIPLDGFTGDILFDCTPGSNNCWNASEQMDGQAHGTRKILTYNPTSNKGVAFRAPSDYTALDVTSSSTDIPASLLADMCAGPDIPKDCAAIAADPADPDYATNKGLLNNYITALMNYLRGDRSNEGSGYNFRVRTTVLGDLVDSSPIFVGRPVLSWPDTAPFPTPPATSSDPDNTYATWKSQTAIKERDEIVYVAANDGMVHGFRTQQSTSTATDAGEAVISYAPTGTFSTATNEGLHFLANKSYSHRYYTDLTPTVSDVYMTYRDSSETGGLSAEPDWRTVLLGGLRGGGRSLFLLDVTNPVLSSQTAAQSTATNFAESNAENVVMWEFSHDELGYTFSKPTIAMMNNGKFAAIFGNGYKSGEDGGSGDCKAKLFIVYLDGGLDGTFTAGTDYHIIDTTVGSVPDAADPATADNCNGLSTPAVVDMDRNGTADRVYAGDLKGNMWAFDICDYDNAVADDCSNVSTNWGLANSSPIMIAKNDAGELQPITVKPVITIDPAASGPFDTLVVFGTGQYLTENDKTTTQEQTMYAVRDKEALSNGRSKWALDPRASGDKFVEQVITETTACAGSCVARTITENSLNNSDNGWYIDLPTTGERVAVNPKIRSDIVFFNTLIPSTATCSYGGSGWLMSVNLENGGSPDRALFDLDKSGTIGDAGDVADSTAKIVVGRKLNVLPAESTFLGKYQYTPGSDGKIDKEEQDLPEPTRGGRMSWRELYDND